MWTRSSDEIFLKQVTKLLCEEGFLYGGERDTDRLFQVANRDSGALSMPRFVPRTLGDLARKCKSNRGLR